MTFSQSVSSSFFPSDAALIRARSGKPKSNNPLFEALVCETYHAALMTAVLASCIYGTLGKRYALDQATVDRYMPVEPAVLLSLTRRSLLDVEPLTDTQVVVENFFLALNIFRQSLAAYLFDAQTMGGERAQVIHGRRLAQVASTGCHEAFRAVRALEIETPGRLPDLYGDHAAQLCKVLLAAERGDTPCLDGKGQPFLPVLPQRRRSMRRSLGQNCRILHKSSIQPGFAKDVSETGLGLLRVPFLVTDDVVAVELKSGRRFRGVIVWCRGESAGLRFDAPLLATDSLLAI